MKKNDYYSADKTVKIIKSNEGIYFEGFLYIYSYSYSAYSEGNNIFFDAYTVSGEQYNWLPFQLFKIVVN